jgi:poly(3-hydroxybutyrate) depolymerase
MVLLVVGAGALVGSRLRSEPAPHVPATTGAPHRSVLRSLVPFRVRYRDLVQDHPGLVRRVRFTYLANGGRRREAFVVLPRWYDAKRHPPIPLVIAPHRRGISSQDNLRFWGALPAFGPFGVVDPAGQGRRLIRYSWGWRGQIDDLSRMPGLVERAVPGLRIDRSKIYAIGSSMGGQETLLLVARHPRLLAGAAALDSATNMAARYREFRLLRDGHRLQHLARIEIGGTPDQVPGAYAARSPITFARQIARSGVPLRLWWSTKDRIVQDQNSESGALFRAIRRINPRAPVTRYVGAWAHSREMRPLTRLPLLLIRFGLIELDEPLPRGIASLEGRSGSVQAGRGTLAR